jgi:hypothetical protein
MNKDTYTSFRKFKLSEEEFRRCWGERYEAMVEAMNANNKMADMTKDRAEKREYRKEANRLYVRVDMLGEIFMSLEMFRVGERK